MSKRIGKGLSALLANIEDERVLPVQPTEVVEGEKVYNIELDLIEANPNQPRKHFGEKQQRELEDSIRVQGVISPIILVKRDEKYMIVAGERRYRAAKAVGLNTIPAMVKQIDERMIREISLIENLQREDLNAIEEAQGYKTLIDVYSLTQEQVAESVGKSRSAVTNALRLLNLNDDAIDALKNGEITAGHARAILAAQDKETASAMLKLAMAGASVRELEAMTKSQTKVKKVTPATVKSNFYSEVEISLKNELGRKVEIKSKGKGKGTITLEFYSDDELAEIAKKIVGE